MDTDIIPWLKREWNVDLTLSEFPYFQYVGPEDSEDVRRMMDQYGCSDIWTLPPRVRESSAYRTDVVAVRLDRRALDRREREVGHLRTLTSGEGWGKEQPHLRAFLNFRRDGPMTRHQYVHDHGVDGKPNGQSPQLSEQTVQWLKARGFLKETTGGYLKAADIGTVFAAVHAVELKREPGEWDTALEQAKRADVYADFRWVAFSERTVTPAVTNLTAFEDAGVGLMSVSSSTHEVTVHTPPVKRPDGERSWDLLSRPYCERWELNERVLKRVTER